MCICCSWIRSWYYLKENSYFFGGGGYLRIVQGQVKEHTACLLAPGGSLKIKGLKSFIHGVTNWLLWSIHYSTLLPLLSCFSHVQLSVWPYGPQPARLVCPWDSLGKGTRVGCHAPLQGIFLTQGLNSHLKLSPALQADSFLLSHQESPISTLRNCYRVKEWRHSQNFSRQEF